MRLIQLVFVSSYVDDYGLDLPKFIERLVFENDALPVRGMTLFANGNIIQLLEGDDSIVNGIFQKLPNDSKQFGVFELLNSPLVNYCLSETSIGYSAHEFKLTSGQSSKISMFQLSQVEVDKRIIESPGKVLMMQFASDYGQT